VYAVAYTMESFFPCPTTWRRGHRYRQFSVNPLILPPSLPSLHFSFRTIYSELDNTKNEPLAIKLRYLLRKQGRTSCGRSLPPSFPPSFLLVIYSLNQPRLPLFLLPPPPQASPLSTPTRSLEALSSLSHTNKRLLPRTSASWKICVCAYCRS